MSTDHVDEVSPHQRLETAFCALEKRVAALESAGRSGASDLPALLDEGIAIVNGLMRAYAAHAGKPIPVSDDPLAVFKAFVKGDPSLTAVRDNVRELVYYRNCLEADRVDALPVNPALMTVHTVRHIYLYLYTRCAQEHRFPEN